MITIELDIYQYPAAGIGNDSLVPQLNRLLDRCDQENIRNVTLRFPAEVSHELEEGLRLILKRPFRFLGWFRTPPPSTLADLFITYMHRITLAATVMPDGRELCTLLEDPVYTIGKPWQVSLFIALPLPPLEVFSSLDGVHPRSGANITLGLGWNNPEAGPKVMDRTTEQKWADVLREQAAWWTERGVTVHLACGLPLCMFSTEQLGVLSTSRIRHPLAACIPELEVRLDGYVRACPLLPSGGWTPMPDGVALKDMGCQLVKTVSFFSSFCNRPHEQSCRSLATRACGGGCLAHNAAMWHGNGPVASDGGRRDGTV